ncbi:hypothetical protein [Kitasatospora sp. NPDC059327]|uniref:hypothetical protein n=1 Tax=Kitasatospora sp. NPDC059327 TaxID=3346803 RepID=UPI00369C9B07
MDQEAARAAVVSALSDVEAMHRKLTALLGNIDGTATAVDIPRQGQWTVQQVAVLWRRAKHLPGVRALFETTAAHAGEKVTFSQILAVSGLDELQQRSEHARLSRLASDLFGEKRWPIENWQGSPDSTSGKAEMVYRMPLPIAAWWRGLEP